MCYVLGGCRQAPLLLEKVKYVVMVGPLKRVAPCDTRGHDIVLHEKDYIFVYPLVRVGAPRLH